MWGFTFDSAAGSLCRSYDAALGQFPSACQTNSGIPMLVITAAALLAALIAAGMVRSLLSRQG